MSSYTITITPDDDKTTTTTLRLDAEAGVVRITDVHLHAGNGLSTGQLPAIDFDLLVRAVSGASSNSAGVAAASPSEAVETRAAVRPRAARRARSGQSARGSASAASRGARTASGRPARPTTVAEGRTRRGDRAYRRTPDDFVEVYKRLGGATAAARHYGVPRHTANGWVRRLREQGALTW